MTEQKRAYNREYLIKNRDKIRALHLKWSEKNRAKISAYGKKSYSKMPEAKKRERSRKSREWQNNHPEYAKKWARENSVKLAVKRAKRRALIQSRIHPDADMELIAKIYTDAEFMSASGQHHEVDHIIPLVLGGYHHELNMQILPRSINRSKRDNPNWLVVGYKTWKDVPKFLWPVGLYEFYEKNYGSQ